MVLMYSGCADFIVPPALRLVSLSSFLDLKDFVIYLEHGSLSTIISGIATTIEQSGAAAVFVHQQVYPGWRGRWLHDDGVATVAARISRPG